ncbi:uncharacterized protein LOC115157732 [Salmo trutta]|uniref:uncharacterized protein LOC115157732 n=1 Tax=Salmo trutta TaxID=8032 RepID=UPI00112FF85D|nr:uncharacterized protein LOC115157732 [Salmo trutta]
MVYLVCVRMSLILLFLLSAFVDDSMEQETITPVKPEVNALQGTDITLSCNYKGDVNNLQWYRHYPGSRPECLLWILQSSMSVQNTSITTPRHTGRLNEEKTRVDLMISSVELEDSALYHCALQPTVTGNSDTLYKNLSTYTVERKRNSFGDSIRPVTTEELVQEGRNVHLSCKYDGTVYTLQWYSQYPRSKPEFLLYITPEGLIITATPPPPRLTVSLDKVDKRVNLKISSADVTDSALYFCAMKTTVTGNSDKLYKNIGTEFIKKTDPLNTQISVKLNEEKNRLYLEISSAEVTDSALYYCAVRPTVTPTNTVQKPQQRPSQQGFIQFLLDMVSNPYLLDIKTLINVSCMLI